MNKLAQRIRERLDYVRISPRRASIEAGLSPAAVGKMLNGTSESPRFSSVQALAEVLQCTPGYLMGTTDVIDEDEVPTPRTLTLLCEARFDTWVNPERLGDTRGTVFAAPIQAEAESQFGVLIADEHANEIAPSGSVLHIVSDFRKSLREGDLIVALRGREGGKLIEVAVWKVAEFGDVAVLSTPSTRPRLQAELRYITAKDHPGGTDERGEIVTILGRAVRAYIGLGGAALYEASRHPDDNAN